MKRTPLAVVIAAGGLLAAAGPAFAVPLACSNYATVAAWAAAGSCIDNTDGDSLWTFGSTTGPLTATFAVQETNFSGTDNYELDVSWLTSTNPALGTPATLSFTVSSLTSGEALTGWNFDTNVQGTGAMSTAASAGLANLVSTNGSRDPLQGETGFSARTTITVLDTFTPGGNAVVNGFSNSFQVQPVPEPGSLALMGFGLLGIGLIRRRRSS